MGRVVVANRDFAPGQVVFHEDPLLIWPVDTRDGVPDSAMIQAFASASTEVRQEVLRLSHPSLASPLGKSYENHARRLVQAKSVKLPVTQVQRLLMINDCNTHAFRGLEELSGPVEVPATMETEYGCPFKAIFLIGSKVEHSCIPNVAYQTKCGHLMYRAVRPIRAGERVSFPYICPHPEQSLSERRSLLETGKLFLCSCELCRGPEMNRPLACCVRDCIGIAFRTERKWTCDECGAVKTDNDMTEDERAGTAEYRKILRGVQSGMRPGTGEKVLQRYQQRIFHSLSPQHYLHAQYHALIAKMAASEALMVQDPQPNQLAPVVDLQAARLLAATSALRLLLWRERLNAVIEGRVKADTIWKAGGWSRNNVEELEDVWAAWRSEEGLKPCPASAKDAFYAGRDMLLAVEGKEQKTSARIFRRYEQQIFSFLAPEDPDRHRVRAIIAHFPY